MAGRRVLVFTLPSWGHLSNCLAMAELLTNHGDDVSFAFVYPPEPWIAKEIADHGYECRWSLRYVRSGLGRPSRDEQHQAVVGAETEIIRAASPDVVLNDVRSTTPVAGRVCGVPVVSILRCPFADPGWRKTWGDAQLVPHPMAWLRLPAPGVVHCRPAWACRKGAAAAQVEPRRVLAALCTASPQPAHLRLILAALDPLDDEWVLSYAHRDEAAAGAPNVVSWLDHDAALTHARVLVCHGGHQLIARAVTHGVPVVVLETEEPHTPVYGEALEAAGAGILIRRGDQTAQVVREQTKRAMDDAALQDGVAALRHAFEALPHAADALATALGHAALRG